MAFTNMCVQFIIHELHSEYNAVKHSMIVSAYLYSAISHYTLQQFFDK